MVSVEVFVDEELSDRRQRRTGLRQVSWDDWVCSVNGERLFLKGANLLPTSSEFADAHPTARCATTSKRRSTSASMRCASTATSHTATPTPPPTNSASCCSRTSRSSGDTPDRSDPRRSSRLGRSSTALGHHPSIAVGRRTTTRRSARCGGALLGRDPERRGRRTTGAVAVAFVRRAAAADVEQVGARPVGEAIVRTSRSDADDRRPFRRRAAPAAARRHRQPPVVRLAARRGGRPRRVRRTPSEHGPLRQRVRGRLGAVDAPLLRRRTRPRRDWPDLDWERLADANGYDIDTFERLFPPSSFTSFDEWRNTTQYYQSHVLKVQIEALRMLKYRPTGGFCFSSLADPAPLVSSSVLDHERVPKDAYEIVRAACAPLLVVAEPLPDWVNPGDRLTARRPSRQRPPHADRLRRRRCDRDMGGRRAALAIRWPDPGRRRGQGRPDRTRRCPTRSANWRSN